MNKRHLKTVIEYVQLKRKEADIRGEIDLVKPRFYKAMESGAPQGLEVNGAIVFSRECPKYDYSKAIKAAEKKLAAMKAAFEKKNAPAHVVKIWAVKF